MAKEKRKRIYLNGKRTKYCVVRLFSKKKRMQKEYKKRCPNDKGHFKISGAHNAYDCFTIKVDGSEKPSKETGTVFLHINECGGGLIAHEFGHAVLWAFKHVPHKTQHPIVIDSMDEEEEILYNLTYAISQFYTWYWKVVKEMKKK